MKIAITADLHLRNRENHPERYNALENILEQIEAENIKTLIIAGDLFDKDSRNYSDFEKICKKHGKVQLLIIPGNHDPDISGKKIVGDNIHIYSSPSIIKPSIISFEVISHGTIDLRKFIERIILHLQTEPRTLCRQYRSL